MPGAPDDLPLRMRLLAVRVITGDSVMGWYPDIRDAISLATELLVADRDTPATVEVASLYRTSSFAESRPLLVEMLTEQGVDPESVKEDPWAVILDAFAGGLLSAVELESSFWWRISTRDAPTPIDGRIAELFDEKERATDPAARAAIDDRLRAVVQGTEPAPATNARRWRWLRRFHRVAHN